MAISYDGRRVRANITIDGQSFTDITVKEVLLGESLLTPGLQTAVTLQSYVYSNPVKNWMNYKNKNVTLNMQTQDGQQFMFVNQRIYRIDNRELDINVGSTESLTLHACDPSLLEDATSLISKSFNCQTPSEVVDYALNSCIGAQDAVIDSCEPTRNYIAEMIHPFQVIQQQCNAALDGEDPSFVHYMTFENNGTHYFRSLKKLMHQQPIWQFEHSETNMDLANPAKVISFSFPCDFDYLSDVLNGLDQNGNSINGVAAVNAVSGAMQFLGAGDGSSFGGGCIKGVANHKQAFTNKGTGKQQNVCELGVEQYLLLRQARMAMLEKDKVALRLTIPWNPQLHVGNSIRFTWPNKSSNNSFNGTIFGTGIYLIASLKHNIQFGGTATTTLDCITRNL